MKYLIAFFGLVTISAATLAVIGPPPPSCRLVIDVADTPGGRWRPVITNVITLDAPNAFYRLRIEH